MKIFRVLALAVIVLGGTAAHGLEAGAAKVRMVMPPGLPLGGLADRLGRGAIGEHDALWARCLYLNDGEQEIYLVSIDAGGVPRALRESVVSLSAEFTVPESVIITATHTHSGPGGMDDRLALRWESGRYNPEYLEQLANTILESMTAARDAKRRATLGYGTTKQTVPLSENARDPKGPIDDQIGVIRVDDADGQAIAILTNFSAQPNLAPASDGLRFSGDYPGAYSREMEDLTEPGCVAFFLNGSDGDQRPVNPKDLAGWDHVNTVGRSLAERAKAVANDLTFRDATLNAFYAEVPLPESLAQAYLPSSTILQALEMDGLLLLFLPGEPCVDLGLSLRRLVLAGGHKAQFTVGLANDDLKCFASRANYAATESQSSHHYFGPDFEYWLHAEVAKMLDLDYAEPERPAPADARREALPGGTMMTFSGVGYARGYQQGQAFRTATQTRYAEQVAAAVRGGAWRPSGALWSAWPPLLDPTALALPALGFEARPLLSGISEDAFQVLEGFSDAVDLPFDAAWLLQNVPGDGQPREDEPSIISPTGTMFALLGERTGASGVIAGRNLDWPLAGAPVVAVVRPDEGRSYVQVGFEWQLGTCTGMNDAGVVLAAERNASLGDPEAPGLPVAFLLRDLLQQVATFDEALARLQAASHIRGYQVLVVAPSTEGWQGAAVAYGKSIRVRRVDDGLLLGMDPEKDGAGLPAMQRYGQVSTELGGEEAIGTGELKSLLTRGGPEVHDRSQVWNSATQHSVVFLPASRTIQVSFPAPDGMPGEYTEIRLPKGDAS